MIGILILAAVIGVLLPVLLFRQPSMPAGTNLRSRLRPLPLMPELLLDRTIVNAESGERVVSQEIFDRILATIAEARGFILVDFFLWNPWLGIIPELSEPTKDRNTPLGFGSMGFFIAHHAGIKAKGIEGYLSEYFQPIFFMAPLNVIGELAKVVSISFRLYGNILGGSIIILIVSHLVYGLVLPPLLICFFGLFVGSIQAFVFTMLTVVYISVQVK